MYEIQSEVKDSYENDSKITINTTINGTPKNKILKVSKRPKSPTITKKLSKNKLTIIQQYSWTVRRGYLHHTKIYDSAHELLKRIIHILFLWIPGLSNSIVKNLADDTAQKCSLNRSIC